MRIAILILVLFLTAAAVADGKKPAPHAAYPMPAGAPVEKPPTRVHRDDLQEMKILQCEQVNENLRDRVLELERQLLERDRAARAARAGEMVKKYMLDATSRVSPDGTIERGGEKK